MNEEEIKAAIAEAVAAAAQELEAKHKTDIAGLKTKNAELIADKKKLSDAADELEEATANASGDIEALKGTHQKALDKLIKERDDATTARNKLLIDNQIASELVANNVSKPFHSILTSALKAQASVENDVGVIEGQPISEYISTFLRGDDGKHYVMAPDTSGSGVTSSTSTSASTFSKPPVTQDDYSRFWAQPVEETNALADGWNRPDLKR